jgi:hypothetical protein
MYAGDRDGNWPYFTDGASKHFVPLEKTFLRKYGTEEKSCCHILWEFLVLADHRLDTFVSMLLDPVNVKKASLQMVMALALLWAFVRRKASSGGCPHKIKYKSFYCNVFFLFLNQGTLDAKMFSRPHCITLLAHFALRAYVASSRNRKAPSLPLIASAPHDMDKGTCLVVGIPPTCEDSPKK